MDCSTEDSKGATDSNVGGSVDDGFSSPSETTTTVKDSFTATEGEGTEVSSGSTLTRTESN